MQGAILTMPHAAICGPVCARNPDTAWVMRTISTVEVAQTRRGFPRAVHKVAAFKVCDEFHLAVSLPPN